MDIAEIVNDKTLKAKQKAETLSQLLLDNKISSDEMVSFTQTAKDSSIATCIEALEFATKQNPTIADEQCFQFVTKNLTNEAPRVKWENAKVIANTAHLFRNKLDDAINHLLTNSEHKGMVVRWSAAVALSAIVKLKTNHNEDLLPAIEAICKREDQNSIRKIYFHAIKK
jgi:hypothetical protein